MYKSGVQESRNNSAPTRRYDGYLVGTYQRLTPRLGVYKENKYVSGVVMISK